MTDGYKRWKAVEQKKKFVVWRDDGIGRGNNPHAQPIHTTRAAGCRLRRRRAAMGGDGRRWAAEAAVGNARTRGGCIVGEKPAKGSEIVIKKRNGGGSCLPSPLWLLQQQNTPNPPCPTLTHAHTPNPVPSLFWPRWRRISIGICQ